MATATCWRMCAETVSDKCTKVHTLPVSPQLKQTVILMVGAFQSVKHYFVSLTLLASLRAHHRHRHWRRRVHRRCGCRRRRPSHGNSTRTVDFKLSFALNETAWPWWKEAGVDSEEEGYDRQQWHRREPRASNRAPGILVVVRDVHPGFLCEVRSGRGAV